MSAERKKWVVRDKSGVVLFGVRHDTRKKWLVGGPMSQLEAINQVLLLGVARCTYQRERCRFVINGVTDTTLFHAIESNGWTCERVSSFRRLMS